MQPPAAVLSFSSTLMLVRVSAEDEITHQCVAENSNQASARLAVTGDPEPPPIPRGLRAMALSTSATRILWEAPPSDRDIIRYALHLRPVGGGCGSMDRCAWSHPAPAPRVCPWASPLLLADSRPFWAVDRPLGLGSSGLSHPSSTFCSPLLALQPGTRRGFTTTVQGGGVLSNKGRTLSC